MSKLYIVGMGPGDRRHMSLEAEEVILQAETIVGYTKYVDLIKDIFTETELKNKNIMSTGMRSEIERCKIAIELAENSTVALICSGDSQIYGMAGLILQLLGENSELEIVVVPGITAAISGGALLGAPLGHDFAVISLSDLLTPWNIIKKRLIAAASGDFVICLYNPSSKNRPDHLKKACDIIADIIEPDTVCGVVQNIGRENEIASVMSFEMLRNTEVDMFTTVFIGSSSTRSIGGRMITPRGYEEKIND